MRDKTRLARGNPGRCMSLLEGQCASNVLWSAVSVEAEDGDPGSSRDRRVIDVLEATKASDNGHT